MGLLSSFLSGALGNGLMNVLPRVEQREQALAGEARRRAEGLQDEQRRRGVYLEDRANDRAYQEQRAAALFKQQQQQAADKLAAERTGQANTATALAVARSGESPENVAAIQAGRNPFQSETGDQDAAGNPIMQADQERFLAAAKIVNQAVADVALKGAADDVQKAEQTRRQGELVNRATQPGATPEDIQRARTFGLLSSGRSGITSLGGGQYIDENGAVQGTPVSAANIRAADARATASTAAAGASTARATRDQSEPTGNARFKALESASARADRLVSDLEKKFLDAPGSRAQARVAAALEEARAAARQAADAVRNFGRADVPASPPEQARAEAVSSGQDVQLDIGGRRTTLEGGTGRERASTPAQTSAAPPVELLKEGVRTKFKNGQVWTLRGGKPVRVD